MNIIPDDYGFVNVIGLQEIETFTCDVVGQTRTFILLSEKHATPKFSCIKDKCQDYKKVIQDQLEFIRHLGDTVGRLTENEKTLSDPNKLSNSAFGKRYGVKKYSDQLQGYIDEDTLEVNRIIEAMFQQVPINDGCVLLTTYLLTLARYSPDCIDIFVETTEKRRDYLLRHKGSSWMHLVGGMFLLNQKKRSLVISNLRDQLLPAARFHGLELRAREGNPYTSTFENNFVWHESDNALVLALTSELCTNDGHDNLCVKSGFNKEKKLVEAISKQFSKSIFKDGLSNLLQILEITLGKVPGISSDTALSFRITARMFDVAAILRILNSSWSQIQPSYHTRCSGVPQKIIYFAGAGHTQFFKAFIETFTVCTTHAYYIHRKPFVPSAFSMFTGPESEYSCLSIPFWDLPFVSSLPYDTDFMFQEASNCALTSYIRYINPRMHENHILELEHRLNEDEFDFPAHVIPQVGVVDSFVGTFRALCREETEEEVDDLASMYFKRPARLQWRFQTAENLQFKVMSEISEWYYRWGDFNFAMTCVTPPPFDARINIDSVVILQECIQETRNSISPRDVNEILQLLINFDTPRGSSDHKFNPEEWSSNFKWREIFTSGNIEQRDLYRYNSSQFARPIFQIARLIYEKVQALWPSYPIALMIARKFKIILKNLL